MRQVTFSKSVMRRLKVMYTNDLKDVVRSLEKGNVIIRTHGYGMYQYSYVATPEREPLQTISKKKVQILLEGGLIREEGTDEQAIQWVLNYDPSQTSIDVDEPRLGDGNA